MSRRLSAIPIVIAALAVALSGCTSSNKSSPPPPTSPSPTATTPTATAPATTPASPTTGAQGQSTLFGPACATLGLDNAAVAGATAAPVGTVAANIPFLKNVVTATNAAGLLNTLNSAPAITVFAPVDDAFKKEPPAQVQALLTDPKMKPQLIATLKFHIVNGKLTKAQLPGSHATLEGSPLTVSGSGDNFTVNGTAKILCGGLQTANATVYLIDTVLHPPAK